jgi:hypothetical protein
LSDLQVDVFDREGVLGQQLFVVSQPNLVKVDEDIAGGAGVHAAVPLQVDRWFIFWRAATR